jgi:nucleotide-binding universal stress UspA family protein
MFQNILVPVDIHEPSTWQGIFPVARKLANESDAIVHLVTVVPKDSALQVLAQFVPEGAEQRLVDEAKERLAALAAEGFADGPRVKCHALAGNVYVEVLNLAEAVGAELVVLSSHRPELKDYLLGPIAARIMRHANCSVFVVRP